MPKSLQVLLRDAHGVVDAEVHAAMVRAGYSEIRPGHHIVLRNLGEGGARPSDLAAIAGVTRQAITKVIDDLERRGIVRREAAPDDGRGVIVRYTDHGLDGLAVARRHMAAMEADFAARIGADRWAGVRAALETLFSDRPTTPLAEGVANPRPRPAPTDSRSRRAGRRRPPIDSPATRPAPATDSHAARIRRFGPREAS